MEKLLSYQTTEKQITLFKAKVGYLITLDSGAKMSFMTLESALKTFDTLINE